MVKMVLIIFIIYEFYIIFSRKHPATSIKHILNKFALDPSAVSESEGFRPMELGFKLALGVYINEPASSTTKSLESLQKLEETH